MNTSLLHEFVAKMTAKNRITFGDVRRLQRNVLPDGISSREQAKLLLRLNAQVVRVDASWTDWLVAGIVEFAVWTERPTGYVEGEAAHWLAHALSGEGAPTRVARRIAREVRREAQDVGEPMVSLADEAELASEGTETASMQMAA